MTVAAPAGTPAGDEPPSRTAVGVVRAGHVMTIMLSGDLDASSGTALDAAVDGILATDPPAEIAIDLSGLDFCDTAGVRALVRAHRLTTTRGTRCRLTEARPHVAWLLRATGAADVLDPGV